MSEILLRRSQFGVHPIAGRIGAEIAGVRLSRRLPAKVLNAIRDALLRARPSWGDQTPRASRFW